MSNDSSDDSRRRWDAFIGWARYFYEWPDFDKEERDYKLVVAARLQAVRRALNDSDVQMWPELMHHAMQPPNNLLYWRDKDGLSKWCAQHPKEARQVLLRLWDETTGASVADRVDRFKIEADHDAHGGQGAIVASFLLMALDPTTYPMYRNEAYRMAYRLTGFPDRPKHGSGAIYQHALDFLDRLVEEARRRSLPLRDRLDAQGALWCVTWYKPTDAPVSGWTEQDRERLLAYRNSDGSAEAEPDEGGRDNEQAVWMFQYEPDAYDLMQYVREHGPLDWWKAKQGRDRMRLGQRVYFLRAGGHEGGASAAVVAVGRIVREPYSAPPGEDHEYRVDVLYDAQVIPLLQREPDLRGDAVLRGNYALREGQAGTNFRLPAAVAERIEELLRDRLRPFLDVEPDLGTPTVPPDVDARTRVVAEVIRRQGQPEFRQRLLAAYERRCAVTGCDAVEALEAAHIAPYRGPQTNDVTNGLLLRADIHTLFDLGLLAVDTETMAVLLAPSLTGTTYAPLAGQPLQVPADAALWPDIAALNEHRHRNGL